MGPAPRIGIFDSGIGGLTIAAAIQQALPRERLLFFGDNAHVPYGERTSEEILGFSEGIVNALMDKGCELIVIACNTASAAALIPLRERMPHIPFVGMEPAVKPAVEHTRTGVVGVLATIATVQGKLFASVVERFAKDVEVIRQACPGLVKQIEAGEFDSPTTETMLRGWIEPMLARNIDALVLGCTHYPLVRPLIEKIAGPGVRVMEPSEAIARRVVQMMMERGLAAIESDNGSLTCYTSGNTATFNAVLQRLGLDGSPVRQGTWQADGSLTLL